MKILFCGDVVGKAGRDCLYKYLGQVISENQVDFVIANGENATHGFGITEGHCKEFFEHKVDVITLGNHAFDRSSIKEYINQDNRVLRPYNYDIEGTEGKFGIYQFNNLKIMVINLIGTLFMHSKIQIKDPFEEIDSLVERYKLKENVDIIIVDFHGEATSEKNAMGFFLDGRVSAVLGTHTHVPTEDSRILPKGSGYRSDVGMCGDYNSIIGMSIDSALLKFTDKTAKNRLEPASATGRLSATLLEIDEKSGLCKSIKSIFKG